MASLRRHTSGSRGFVTPYSPLGTVSPRSIPVPASDRTSVPPIIRFALFKVKTLPVRFANRDINPEFVPLVDLRHPAG
jgi:hypothetical protein